MKKIYSNIRVWWLKETFRPRVMKQQRLVITWLVRPIIAQLRKAGVGFYHINKWLLHIGHPQICGYMMLPKINEPLVFFDEPTQERRRELGGNYVMVAKCS